MDKEKREQEIDEPEVKGQKQEKEESLESGQDEEREGIIPADMDFKKFLGCGG